MDSHWTSCDAGKGRAMPSRCDPIYTSECLLPRERNILLLSSSYLYLLNLFERFKERKRTTLIFILGSQVFMPCLRILICPSSASQPCELHRGRRHPVCRGHIRPCVHSNIPFWHQEGCASIRWIH